jgi:hypothetical protein
MTPEEKVLTTFETRVRQFILQYNELKNEKENLCKKLEEKDEVIKQKDFKIAQMEKTYANLKLAKMIEIRDSEINDAKSRLSKLVREVNKCITLLQAN